MRWLQSTLNQVLGLTLTVDGVMGVQTRSALRDFQSQQGLVADGIAGPDTREALMAARRRLATGVPSGPAEGAPVNGQPADGATGGNGAPDAGGAAVGDAGGTEQEQFLGPLWKWLGGYGSPNQAQTPATAVTVDRNSPAYIRWVQGALNRVLGLRLAVDGISGTQTRSAIRSFQQRQGLVADGIVGQRTEQALIAAGGGQPPGSVPTPPTSPTTPYAPSSRARLAQQILAHKGISLWPNSPVGGSGSDGADARSNMEATARNQPAQRSSYGNAPGGTVLLDPRMLEGMLRLAGKYSIRVTSIAGGSHSTTSRHYAGIAFDVDRIKDVAVNASNPHFRTFMQMCRDLGATEVIGPGSAGHSTHVHCAWPRP